MQNASFLRLVVIAGLMTCGASGLAVAQEVTPDPAPVSQGEVSVDSGTLAELLEMMILQKGVDIVAGNIKASERESGDIDKAIRATLGISIRDIETYGLLGGPNSEMRKLFEALGLA